LKPAVFCAVLLEEVDFPPSSEVVFCSAYVAAFHFAGRRLAGQDETGKASAIAPAVLSVR
jgi:hypothetical protein